MKFSYCDIFLEFVDWLLELSLMSMYPGACYQRKKTAMDWLGTIYDSSTHDPTSQQRKSITPGKFRSYSTDI